MQTWGKYKHGKPNEETSVEDSRQAIAHAIFVEREGRPLNNLLREGRRVLTDRVCSLDRRTRGFIEKGLDEVLETDITNGMRWIPDIMPLGSPEEFALGYVLGSLMGWAHNVIKIRRIARISKTKTPDEIMKLARKDISEKDATEIRDMLIRRILDIVEIINRELNR